MSGSRAIWKEVLAVYAVKTNTDSENPQEVATMDDSKKKLLANILWEMNEISHKTETKTETVIEETDDGHNGYPQALLERSYSHKKGRTINGLAFSVLISSTQGQHHKRN